MKEKPSSGKSKRNRSKKGGATQKAFERSHDGRCQVFVVVGVLVRSSVVFYKCRGLQLLCIWRAACVFSCFVSSLLMGHLYWFSLSST